MKSFRRKDDEESSLKVSSNEFLISENAYRTFCFRTFLPACENFIDIGFRWTSSLIRLNFFFIKYGRSIWRNLEICYQPKLKQKEYLNRENLNKLFLISKIVPPVIIDFATSNLYDSICNKLTYKHIHVCFARGILIDFLENRKPSRVYMYEFISLSLGFWNIDLNQQLNMLQMYP